MSLQSRVRRANQSGFFGGGIRTDVLPAVFRATYAELRRAGRPTHHARSQLSPNNVVPRTRHVARRLRVQDQDFVVTPYQTICRTASVGVGFDGSKLSRRTE